MKSDNQTSNVVRIESVNLPFVIAVIVCLISFSIIMEWTFGIKILARFSPTDSSMKVNTSIIFLLFGISLLLHQFSSLLAEKFAKACAILGLIFAALILSQYFFHINLGLDELFVRDHPNPDITSSPGRISPLVAFNFILVGLALFFWKTTTRNNIRPSEYLGAISLFIPIIVTIGYVFNATSLYSFTSVTGVALIAALVFIILLIGILAVRGERGLTTILLSQTRGGLILRFLLPTSLLTIILIDWLCLKASQSGFISASLVAPIGTITSGTVIAVLIWRSAKLLYEADIKEKQTIAELKRAYQTAEEANRAKDEFISIVSHELRTPLNAILGWLSIVRVKPTEESIKRALEVIQRQSDKQLKLVEDLLDTSRIISGKMRLEIDSLQIDKIIDEAVEIVRPAATAKNIELIVENNNLKNELAGDGSRLLQVFWNLLSNAVKFTPNNGIIKIETSEMISAVQIKVTDSGEGIDKKFVPYVFERFSQSENSTTKRNSGLGLGLSLAKDIIELHGGIITVHSEGIGKGSTFTIRLPIHKTV